MTRHTRRPSRAHEAPLQRIPGVAQQLQPFAIEFCTAVRGGAELIRTIVDSGWTLSHVAEPAKSSAARTTPSEFVGWVLRARPPKEIAGSFDLHVEVLFHCTQFKDLQARTVETTRRLMETDDRAGREIGFLVTGDEGADEKIAQIPNSAGIVPLSWTWVYSAANGGQGQKPLRGRLEKFLYSRDLFDEQAPVVGSRFFGRQRLLAQLNDYALSDTYAGLFGLRKIGKTSLLHTLRDSLRQAQEPPFVLPVYLDLQAVPFEQKNWRFLLWDIGRRINREWERSPASHAVKRFRPKFMGQESEPPLPGQSADLRFASDLEQLSGLLDRPEVRGHVLVILDEVELLVAPSSTAPTIEGAVDFLRLLRGNTQQGLRLSVVVAGANPFVAEQSSLGGQENPLLNFIRKHYVEPFDLDETRRMLNGLGGRMGLRFQHEASRYIYEQTGGHPFVTRQLCSALLKQLRRTRPYEVQRQDVRKTLDIFLETQLHTFGQVFESLAFYPDEQYLLKQLAKGDIDFVASWAKADPSGLAHLHGYGLVTGSGDTVEFAIPLFREYLMAHG